MMGLVYYVAQGGLKSLNVANIDWLQKDNDWSQHFIGWAFARHAPLSFPLGLLPDLGRPVGTRVAYMDSNPLLVFALRPWASFLPEPFQFIGPWMALCLMLQGYFGAKLTRALLSQKQGGDGVVVFFGAALFVVAPILLHRLDHDTLMAQWLIVAGLWLCVRDTGRLETVGRTSFVGAVILGVVASAVHPYLLAMVAPLYVIGAVRAWVGRLPCTRTVALRKALVAVCLWALPAMLTLWAAGYISQEDALGSDGFGFFAADLSALFNSMGWSRSLAPLPYHRGQAYEGFGFMGLGALALVAVAWGLEAAKGFWGRRPPHIWAVAFSVGACALFSLSSRIHWLGQVVFDLSKPYAHLKPITAALRSSGRFSWPLHYALLASAIWIVCHRLKPAWARYALGLAVLVQLLDTQPREVWARLQPAPHTALIHPLWGQVAPGTRHVVLIPPIYPASSALQCGPYPPERKAEVAPAVFAAQHRMSINSVYTARIREAKTRAYCQDIQDTVQHQRFDTESLYLIDRRLFPRAVAPQGPLRCWDVDGVIGCVHRDHSGCPKSDGPYMIQQG